MSSHPPTDEQLKVIESEADDILVVAGAGTGKTTTMVARYVHLLKERELEPREILAFTFTDKAAGELRERVRSALQDLARGRGEAAPMAVSMSDAWIGTFHAICLRILKAWPIESGVDPGFTVIDDVTSETLRGEAFSAALDELRKEADDRADVLEMIGILREAELRKAVIFAYDELRSRGIIEPSLPDFERTTSYPDDLIEELTHLASKVRPVKKWGVKQDPAISLFEDLAQNPRRPSFDEVGGLDFSVTNAEGDVLEFETLIRTAAKRIAAFEFGDRYRDRIGQLLKFFGKEYEERKAARGVLDYEDLQLKTVAMLKSKDWVRRSYLGRFREIMVDEFQDTNPLQLQLVELLRNDPEGPVADAERPATTLITVGDEMQSIYGFRHADVELFRSRAKAPGVSMLPLTMNFRSSPAVIDAVNTIGTRLRNQVDPQSEFPTLEPGLPASEDESVEIFLTDADGWKSFDLGPLAPKVPDDVGAKKMHHYEAEALRVARQLHDLVRIQGVPQSEIAILLRATTRVALFAKALRQFGLTPYVAKSSGYWESREALDMRALLGVIANPLDDESLLTVLTSPACGLTSDALWLLADARPGRWVPLWRCVEWCVGRNPIESGKAESIGQVPAEDVETLNTLVETLDDLRRESSRMPLDELALSAAERTGYDLASLADDPSGNSWAGVRRFASLAREYEENEGHDLRGLLDWAALSAELDRESETATADENSDVIRVMTIHAAKGLEFGVVCLPDCGRGCGENNQLMIRMGRAKGADESDFPCALRLTSRQGNKAYLYGWDSLKDVSGVATEAEELRLFHVALTRAKRKLMVSGITSKLDSDAISRSMLVRTCSGIEGLGFDGLTEWNEPRQFTMDAGNILTVHANAPGEKQAESLRFKASGVEQESSEIESAPPLGRPAFSTFPNVPLSFTAMNEFAECPTAFYAKRIMGLPEPEETGFGPEDPETASLLIREDATRFGSAVHDVLEAAGKRNWKSPTEDELRAALDSRRVLSDENLSRAAGMIDGFLKSPLGEQVRGSKSSFEAPLLIRFGQVTVRGFADLILEDEPPIVLDYKTNRLGEKTPEEKMADYLDQRDLYALALAEARGLEEVGTAYVFLEQPDRPVTEVLGRDDLDQARERIQVSLAEITAGRYFGGPGARQPCGDCWACRELGSRILAA
ncbi:MAG: UvrD-helicase domain-containing protein [Solirubrobacterales bacterium]|nr:UvrD-helicase domain-containing protein [Solirubrobacterales bacterium]